MCLSMNYAHQIERCIYSSKVSCSFETQYHTDQAIFGVDQNDVESGSVEGASTTSQSFTFDLTLTTDHQLIEELPEGYTRVIGDMNYFKVNYTAFLCIIPHFRSYQNESSHPAKCV